LAAIIIGADVSLSSDSFDNNFEQFYTQNGRRAGTYSRSGNTWMFSPR
jgi:hypothetical protein